MFHPVWNQQPRSKGEGMAPSDVAQNHQKQLTPFHSQPAYQTIPSPQIMQRRNDVPL